ncbi:MAG: prohibitin family protein, partial [Cyanobacteria bacterium]|nr:prohibitin family protein [Cyanobacteriota bacterium]
MRNQSSFQALGGVILAGIVILVLNAFVIISPGQAGVLSILGKAQDRALLEGIHLKPPFIGT